MLNFASEWDHQALLLQDYNAASNFKPRPVMVGNCGIRCRLFLEPTLSQAYAFNRGRYEMKKLLMATALMLAVPAAANAQSDWFSPSSQTYQGFYVGIQGGANWLLNNQSYVMDTGWTAGGKVGYDFVGPRVELEGMYHYNTGSAVVIFPTGYANVTGRMEQVSVMANVLYDFFPGATVTPYIGGGAGVAFVDANIQGCKMCLTMFAYQGILGLGFNATPAMRIGLEGRYYGTTNPGAYLTRTHGAAEPQLQVRPADHGRTAPAAANGRAAVVHGVLRLGSLELEPAGFEHDQAGGRRLQDRGNA